MPFRAPWEAEAWTPASAKVADSAALNTRLERRNDEVQSPLPLRPSSRPSSSGGWQPQDLIAAQMENAKLRELVSLLRQKLAQGSP